MKKVLLIYGGVSPEHDVSCASANAILENIDKSKFVIDTIYITKDNEWLNNDKKIINIIKFIKTFDIIFPIIHGKNGEDGKLQGMLDLLNIKYVGSKCGPSYICMDKQKTKEILKYYNIPQVPYQTYKKNHKLNIPFPVIIKPACGGSSIGIKVARNKNEYNEAVKNALKYDKKVIIEQYLNVQELECAVLKDKNLIVSEIGEIVTDDGFYDYENKYINGKTKTNLNADIPQKIKNKIKNYAKKIFEILELDGYARIDFFYDKHNIYLNEINTIPGFTPISMFPKLIMNEKIDYQSLITKLIENA